MGHDLVMEQQFLGKRFASLICSNYFASLLFAQIHLLLWQVYLVGGQKDEERIVPNIVRLDFCNQEMA